MTADWRLTSALTALHAGIGRLREEDSDAAIELGSLAEAEDVDEACRAMVRAIQEAEDTAAATKARMTELSIRAKRFEARAERYRGILLSAMDAMSWRKREWPEATVTIRAPTPGVVITDADALPEAYKRVKVEPDKGALRAALGQGEVIPGAELANGMPSLMIRGS